jgi:hypothetical protein
MKIETLQQALQAAFTGAYRGLRSQRWQRCVDKRGEGGWNVASRPGPHCALGWLIPEERQQMNIGPYTVADTMRIVADPLRRWYYRGTSYEQGAFERFLYELLEAHDDSTCPASMRRAIHKIARRHGLTIPPPEQRSRRTAPLESSDE